MITKLHLESFGLYREVSFDLGPVTAFVGPNESGKTTLFHALLDCLCRPRGASTHARALQSRYGKLRSCTVEPPDWDGAIPVEEFTELLAIDSGAITLNVSENSDWMQAVKANLFSGGIDPSAITRDLRREASENKTYAHMKRLKELQSRLESLEQERDRLSARRAEILGGERRLQQQTREHEELENTLRKLQQDHTRLEKHLAAQSAAMERRRARALLAKIETVEELERELELRAAFSEDAEPQLAALETGMENTRSHREHAVVAHEHRRAERETALRAHRSAEHAAAAQQQLAEAAKSLRRNLEHSRAAPITRTKRRPRPLVLAAAGVLLATAAVPFLVLTAPESLVVGAALAAGALILGGFAGFEQTVEHDNTPVENALRRARDEWQRETGEQLSAESYEGLISALTGVESKAAAARDELQRRGDELQDQEHKLTEARAAEQTARRTAEAAQQELNDWLARYGLAGTREYHNARAEYRSRRQRRDELTRELHQAADQYGCTGRSALRGELARLLERTTEAEVEPKDNEALRRTESRRAQLAQEIEQLRARRDAAAAEIAELRGTVKGSLGEIPEQLLDLETRIARLDREIGELNDAREAAAIAAEIFEELGADFDHVLEDLARDIQARFGAITGNERRLSLPKLAVDAAEVIDAGGTARPPAQLSKGTLDAFLLAARIALALQARDGEGILVLDEPFQSLDTERTLGALKLLEHVHRENNVQLLFFTKDERLLDACTAVFAELRIHRLQLVGRA